MTIELTKNMTILFQGDSITDCSRDAFGYGEMGYGYAYIASSNLCTQYPELNLNFINRGVSGNCIEDILYRWDKDCLQLKPDVVSILVGINNTWQAYEGINTADNKTFYTIYHRILQQARDSLNPQFILCEPFLLHVSEEIKVWREDIDKKIEIIKNLASEFNAVLVPFDKMYAEASQKVVPAYWAPDGVHPTQAGHELMAREWIKCVINNNCK